MSHTTIISCALTGGGDTTAISAHVPVTPKQIAGEALAARAAGAAIVHIHVRDPETGKPSRELRLYQEVVDRIRDAGSDVLINLTTGAGGRYVPDESDPNRNAIAGMATPEQRMEHVLQLRPDICSLDIGTMNFGAHAFLNLPAGVEKMAAAIRAAGIKPELEIFDLGHAAYARHLYDRQLLDGPLWFQFCLGVPWGAPATAESLMAMRQLLPPEACWSAFGISRYQFPMVAQAVLLGGHVRVGLEDNLYLTRGQLAPGNASLVERAARIVRELDAEVATPDQAREILGLARR
ncbi:3-keto-5-aminohexanoate cleavage protein [Variovorax defluvii]|uniref:3-keto-5-aminohexanoate cleavage protein n=1 Tax=Variovorax defluvii TaxID=913761 RepID=A0ABP8HT30_9BURK